MGVENNFSDELYMNLNVEIIKARKMDAISNVDSQSSCKELSKNLNFKLFQSKNFSSILQVSNSEIKLPPGKLKRKEDIFPGKKRNPRL